MFRLLTENIRFIQDTLNIVFYTPHSKNVCKHNTGSSILSNENQGKIFSDTVVLKKVKEDPREIYIACF